MNESEAEIIEAATIANAHDFIRFAIVNPTWSCLLFSTSLIIDYWFLI